MCEFQYLFVNQFEITNITHKIEQKKTQVVKGILKEKKKKKTVTGCNHKLIGFDGDKKTS